MHMPSSKGNRGRNNRKSKSSKTSRKATRRSVDPSSSNTSGSSSPLMHFSPPMALNTTHIFKVQSRKRDRRNALKESIRRLYHNAYPSWIEIPRRYDRELTVGTEPFSNALYVPKYDVVDSISMMRDVLDEMDLGHVTTTIGHGVDVFNISKVPSESGLHDDIKGMMLKLLEFFNKTGSPFVVNMFPLQTVRDVMNYPIEFTFFDNMSNLTITDGNATYTNAVELIYDSVESGIINAGYPNMKIVIGEIGWPTDGYPDAYIKNAERFNKGLLKFIASKQGTPLRPRPIEAYLHSLSDENKFLTTFGAYQRH
ncbi:hypothetical protein T459_13851 [Capsicum annuum]|uniref:Glucan endo-1,3-beta-D-glucosidase n=1 Tax=Capsicum annuum TaxID=4072 RepID=A0A2G2ZFR3_CAPAN|nr:hypothetical protein T459_13851 [Capsicum annuum]